MNTKSLSIQLLSSLILLSILFLAACSTVSSAPVVLAQSETIEKSLVTGSENTKSYGEDDVVRSWEINLDDIAAAREAALLLSQTFATAEVDYGEDDVVRSWEINLDDIAAAREAAQYLAATLKIALQQEAGGG